MTERLEQCFPTFIHGGTPAFSYPEEPLYVETSRGQDNKEAFCSTEIAPVLPVAWINISTIF